MRHLRPRTWRKILLAGLLYALLVPGCASGPLSRFRQLHPGQTWLEYHLPKARRITADPAWRVIYDEVEACVAAEDAAREDYYRWSRLRWFRAHSVWRLDKRTHVGYEGVGIYFDPGDIVLADLAFRPPWDLTAVVRHELVHHFAKEGGHPEPLFAKCAP